MQQQLQEKTVYGLLRDAVVNQKMTQEEAADYVLDLVDKDELANFVRPILVNEARRFVRRETKFIEQDVVQQIERGDDPLSVRRKLLQEEFFVDEKIGWVRYADSTIEHHERRASYQEIRSKSLREDAEFHRQIAREMREARVKYFRELAPERQKFYKNRAVSTD